MFSAGLSLAYALLLAGAPWTLGVCGYRLCKALDGGLAMQLGAWIAAALLTLAAVLMAIGAKTGRRELLLPWLVFGATYVGFWLAGGLVALVLVWLQGAPWLATAMFFVALNMAVLPVYFLATVAALFLQIREQERAAAERALGGATSLPRPVCEVPSAPAPTL